MKTHTDKTQKIKTPTVVGSASQKQSNGGSTFQFVDNRPEALTQRKLQEMANNSPQTKQIAQLQAIADNHSAQQQNPIQKKENKTGLPDNLKTGMENLSGMSLDDVRVHRNSEMPAQLQAHAYAHGPDIHLGRGQEKYLPHEAWHVVQQKKGRVTPTLRAKGIELNDDPKLEIEADVMGEKAALKANAIAALGHFVNGNGLNRVPSQNGGDVQYTEKEPPTLLPYNSRNNHDTQKVIVAIGGTVQRKINWDSKATAAYKQSAEGLLAELTQEFFYVDKIIISSLIKDIEGKLTKWSPFQAYQGIKNYLRQNYPLPSLKLDLTGTNITSEEASWYFISNFKTFMEAIVDDEFVFKFVNTPDDNHAEDNMMQRLDEFIAERGWNEDFSESHTLLIRINNSPCRRCAKRIYEWANRDIFDTFEVQFANMYEKTTGFTEAATRLRSGGIVMSLLSVFSNLIPLITKEENLKAEAEAQRKPKDAQEASDWHKWLAEHGSNEKAL